MAKAPFAAPYRGKPRQHKPGTQLDWFATLSHQDNLPDPAASPSARRRCPLFKPQPAADAHLNLIVLDTSASSLNQQALNQALAATEALCREAYLQRQHCTLITFGNNRATTLIAPQRASKQLSQRLQTVQAGGGTPLRQGLQQALSVIWQYQHRYSSQTLYLLTDGKSNDPVSDLQFPCPLVVVDTELAAVPLHRAQQLAQQLKGDYQKLSNGSE